MNIPILQGDIGAQIQSKPLPVVIEFYAVWCPKCSMMNPVFERVANSLRGQVFCYKVDIDISERLAAELGVEIVPTFVIYRQGTILGYTTGVISEPVLRSRILQLITQ